MFASLISILNQNNGRLYKEQKLHDLATNCPQLLRLFERTYSPEYVYGVKKVDRQTTGNKTLLELWPGVEILLDHLTSRQLTGHAARDAVSYIANQLTDDEYQVFVHLFKGDLRCGINTSSINKVFPGTVPEYPYMRCSLMKGSNIEKFVWSEGIFSQEKADGMFANVFLFADGSVKITSRQGTVFINTEFKEFISEFSSVAKVGNCYHGELLVLEDGKVMPRELGNGVLNSVLKGGSFASNQLPFYYVWDMVPITDCVPGGKYKVAYKDRFGAISNIKGTYVDVIPTKIVYSLKEAFEHYVDLTSRGIEGTVIKNPRGIWEDKTSKDQIKLKIEAEVDLIVRGFNPGNGKNSLTFGSIACESSCGRLKVNVSGISDEDRKRIDGERDEWIDKKIITVKANSVLESGEYASLFLPRLVEERLDKREADDLDKIKLIFEEAKRGV